MSSEILSIRPSIESARLCVSDTLLAWPHILCYAALTYYFLTPCFPFFLIIAVVVLLLHTLAVKCEMHRSCVRPALACFSSSEVRVYNAASPVRPNVLAVIVMH